MTTIDQIFAELKSGDGIFIHGAAATPQILIERLIQKTSHLKNLRIYHLHTEGPPECAHPEYQGQFKIKNLFVGSNIRKWIDFNDIDYIPCFLSEMPLLFRSKKWPIKLSLIQTSAPDRFGFVSLGTSVDTTKAAIESSQFVIAEINQKMPWINGDGAWPVSKINASIETNQELYSPAKMNLTNEEIKIGSHVAELIEDGSCLQMGIGQIPNAVLASLKNHKNLGLHSEMCSDGVLPLLESGIINNSEKKFHRGKSVCTFMMGNKELYQYVHNNPHFYLLEADYVNNPTIIARHKKMVAINSAIEVDLTGQVCADSVGSKIISGVGGQIDFIRGASLSERGKPIIAITSRSKKGQPRIVPWLKEGAGVVTTRAHIHYVVTEYGVADLYGQSIGERAKALINIAHPEDQENLKKVFYRLTNKIL